MTRLMIDLCAGVGGFSLAAHWLGYLTVAFAEPDKFCQQVLRKNFGNAKIYDYARQVTTDALGYRPGDIDLITAGFPCQPFSVAGKQRGKEDDRYIWQEISGVIKDFKPALFVGENVTGVVGMALDDVLDDLESHGYATQAFIIPAASVGAPHKRERVWITAKLLYPNADSQHGRRNNGYEERRQPFRTGSANVTDTYGNGHGRLQQIPIAGCKSTVSVAGVSKSGNVTDADRERCEERDATARRPATGQLAGRDITGIIADAANERLQSAGRTRDGQPRFTDDDGRLPVSRLCGLDDGLSAGLDGFTNYWQHNAMPPPIDHERRKDRTKQLRAYGNAIVPQLAYEIIKALSLEVNP